VKDLNLSHLVKFTGLIPQAETLTYYNQADIFCFPSIREFGGAVVLEAMASGLPCIVVNNGGIGEYVTEETGFKIEPVSREFLIREVANKLEILIKDENLRLNMSSNAINRAKEFVWSNKAEQILNIYNTICKNYNE
jgi:glycosyltransferase involved in cell wall biosynthesis